MLAIEAITKTIARIIADSIPEFGDRIHLNRTRELSDERGEVPAVTISQGSESPFGDLTDWDFTGWLCTVQITFTSAGTDEDEIVSQLNAWRMSAHSALVSQGRLGLPFVAEANPSNVDAPVTYNSGSKIVKDLVINWQVVYRVRRDNPNVNI